MWVHYDPATGLASAAQQETVAVNALGQPLTSTDRNGTTHALGYDALGRVTDDAVTLLGVNVDGAFRRVHTDYDGQGNDRPEMCPLACSSWRHHRTRQQTLPSAQSTRGGLPSWQRSGLPRRS